MTRPLGLSTMSGNFDYPPASGREASNESPNLPSRFPTTAAASNAAPPNPTAVRLQEVQEVLRFEREERDRRAMSDNPPDVPIAVPPTDHRRQRAIIRNISSLRAQRQATLPTPPLPLNAPLSGPGEARLRLRPRATPAGYYLQRPSTRDEGRPVNSLSDLQQAGARLAEASSDLRSLLDDPVRISSPDITIQEYSGEAEVNRRFKRRRLDSSLAPAFPRIKYGYYGQVESGQLKMEIVTCDGGNYPDAEGKDRAYWAENVLRNDKSVYCTKSGQCNLLLRHQGSSPFCLNRLVIKAPRLGFTAPVQEGMVFVSMTSDDLLGRTADYQMVYPHSASPINHPPLPRPEQSIPRHRVPSLLDGAREWASSRPIRNPRRPFMGPWSAQHNTTEEHDFADSPAPPPETDLLYDSGDNCDDQAGDERTNAIHAAQPNTTLPIPPPFMVTTDCTDDEDEDEDEEHNQSTPEVIAVTLRRSREPIPLALSENEDDLLNDGEGVSFRNEGRPILGRRSGFKLPVRLSNPNPIAWTTRDGESGRSERDGVTEADMLAPHARFFIKKDKSKCSLFFDPPVSGRFMLLKFWSPAPDENIDIQSVVAHGFAGPRFFPAKEMR